ncbi:MAG: tetratricopeptide repeat protein [Candidatus Omnitrophica bacterium]|nr:tetratricopeptide repeat protein [Candidatus Omnitrophota bacterium]
MRKCGAHRTLSPGQKAGLFLLSAALFILVLEAGLRAGGAAFLALQERRNRASISKKGSYRILCLGESTTALQYPAFLEAVLNTNAQGIRVSVIDKGVSSITTTFIVENLERNLDAYQPDLVVTMMGINDGCEPGPHKTLFDPAVPRFMSSLRTYKLFRLLGLHMTAKLKEAPGGQDRARRLSFRHTRSGPAYAFDHPAARGTADPHDYIKEGNAYLHERKFNEAEGFFKQAFELNPRSADALVGLGYCFFATGRFSEAEGCFQDARARVPDYDNAFVGSGIIQLHNGDFSAAEGFFMDALSVNPVNHMAFTGLGWSYQNMQRFREAEGCFKLALGLDPGLDEAYSGLGLSYHDQENFSAAEVCFKKAIECNPLNIRPYLDLGLMYKRLGRIDDALDVFQKVVVLFPRNDRGYAALSNIYFDRGDFERAGQYERVLDELRTGNFCPQTAANYRALKAILDKRGIPYVCVQYPMRSIALLKQIFRHDSGGIIFVDNEKIFKDAVLRERYADYFIDSFGGDFGHCTDKGNMLLAENIAGHIMKRLFPQ